MKWSDRKCEPHKGRIAHQALITESSSKGTLVLPMKIPITYGSFLATRPLFARTCVITAFAVVAISSSAVAQVHSDVNFRYIDGKIEIEEQAFGLVVAQEFPATGFFRQANNLSLIHI